MSLFFGAPAQQRAGAHDVVFRTGHFDSQRQQIDYLREIVVQYRALPAIRELARDVIFRQRPALGRNEAAYAVAIASWVQETIAYVRETPEVFQSPTYTLSIGSADCEDFATLICSLVESLGIESELVGLEWPDETGDRSFQHIYPRAVVVHAGRKVRVPLDATLERPIAELVDPLVLAAARKLDVRIYVG